jgi:glycosyltransferase involved in cell wall biosynthesis
MKDLKVLACTFTACPPDRPGFRGGEDVLGWNMLVQIARNHQVWALTNADDRMGIEQALNHEPINNLHFCFVSLPSFLRPLLRIQGGHQFYYYLWQLKAYMAARKLHKETRFDLFHHITYANDWMPSFIGALLPVKYIRGPGGGAHRTPRGFESEYTFKGRIWEKVRSVSQWIFRHDPTFYLGQARASALLLCNKESISQVPKKWSHKTHPFPVNGVSSDDLTQRRESPKNSDNFRVLTAGSLIRVKGIGLAIKAFQQFHLSHGSSEFIIVGSGPEESHLRSLVHQLGLEEQIHFVQAMPRRKLLAEMSGCDAFLFPSLRDGGGAVVIEAMAMGKPVVCLDTGGPAMHINDDCGHKVPVESPTQAISELADALGILYEDPTLKYKQGLAAAERALDLYHWDRLGNRLMGIYDQVHGSDCA